MDYFYQCGDDFVDQLDVVGNNLISFKLISKQKKKAKITERCRFKMFLF